MKEFILIPNCQLVAKEDAIFVGLEKIRQLFACGQLILIGLPLRFELEMKIVPVNHRRIIATSPNAPRLQYSQSSRLWSSMVPRKRKARFPPPERALQRSPCRRSQ